jgi:cell division protein FtsI/penicillin-binding protein 2
VAFERRLGQVQWTFLLIMLMVPLRLAILQWVWRPQLNSHPYNGRLQERLALRATVSDRRGHRIAYSDGNRRVYPFGSLLAHWTGFYSLHYGVAGLERWKQELLRERREQDGVTSRPGHTFKASLDLSAQRRLQANFPDMDGAALVVDLDRGQVLAACSRPDFEPSRVGVDWSLWQKDARAPLLNRPFLGLYPAGPLWTDWESQFRSLPHRPATLMDWAEPHSIDGQWLISPAHVACVILHLGSPLPLSQTYSEHRRTWAPKGLPRGLRRCSQGWERSQSVVMGSQVVCWAIALRRPYLLVSVWEQSQDRSAALRCAWKSIPPP